MINVKYIDMINLTEKNMQNRYNFWEQKSQLAYYIKPTSILYQTINNSN